MKSAILNPEKWCAALIMLDRNLSPSDNQSQIAKRHIENARWIIHCDHREKTSGISFEHYAQLGEEFLRGCLACEQAVGVMESSLPVVYCEVNERRMFTDKFLIEVQSAIACFRRLQKLDTNFEQGALNDRKGRNWKPNLHEAMHIAHKIWKELGPDHAGPASRFLAFAEICFEDCRGVTKYGLRDSYRRHIAPSTQS